MKSHLLVGIYYMIKRTNFKKTTCDNCNKRIWWKYHMVQNLNSDKLGWFGTYKLLKKGKSMEIRFCSILCSYCYNLKKLKE